MKAVVMHDFGPPSVLRYEDVPTPQPRPTEVLIKVGAVGVNRSLDVRLRAGQYAIKPPLPHVLGCDPAGTVVEVGDEVGDVAVGERVTFKGMVRCGTCPACLAGRPTDCQAPKQLGTSCWGGYAEFLAVPASNLGPCPENLSLAEASMINRHFPQAFRLLEDSAGLRAGEWLLVMGAAGALGSCLVQVGKLLGARVIAGAGTDERVASCLVHGADFGVNYRAGDFAAEVLRITDGRGVDVVAENIADRTIWPGAFKSLGRGGRLVTVGAHGGGIVEIDVNQLYMKQQRIIGTFGSRPQDVASTMKAAAEGKIHAVIGQIMPLSAAAEAHRLVEENLVTGKVMLEP
ncbi:MAG TPA: alcohol dehydrogenase catalytic domain-containing protein [Chloroflexota bacterium]